MWHLHWQFTWHTPGRNIRLRHSLVWNKSHLCWWEGFFCLLTRFRQHWHSHSSWVCCCSAPFPGQSLSHAWGLAELCTFGCLLAADATQKIQCGVSSWVLWMVFLFLLLILVHLLVWFMVAMSHFIVKVSNGFLHPGKVTPHYRVLLVESGILRVIYDFLL